MPSYLELNPLVCYVSASEAYLDEKTMNRLISDHFPMTISTDVGMKYKADLAILPEVDVLESIIDVNDSPYAFMSPIENMSFAFIQQENRKDQMRTFSDVRNRHIYIKKGGYVELLWKYIFRYINYETPPKVTYYTSEDDAIDALVKGRCDAIGTLMSHPNMYVLRMSYILKINIIPWDLNEQLVDVMSHYMRGLKKTTISLKDYRYTGLNTELQSFGFSLDLFVKKSLPPSIVTKITEIVFKPKGIMRSAAIGGSHYISFHEGTKHWLENHGLISTTEIREHPGCALLAGKSKCEGTAADFAKLTYEREFWGSTEPNTDSTIAHLINANSNKNDPDYGHVYKRVIDSSYMCIEDGTKLSKESCERAGNTWDRPCLSNDECPFYNKNQNYPNTYGKCIDGFCEMPLGVKRKGYRKFISKPICHNCPFSNPSCCVKKDRMASPDYAFKGDRIERIANKDELRLRGIVT